MTRTYRTEFFTAADYAVRNFEADTPEQALQLARQFYDDDPGELDFRSYDDNAALEHIQIWDPNRGTLATWETDDYRLRQAAPDMLSLLKRINNAFYVKGSRKALLAVMKETKPLIARAEGRQP
jgi:hypothetical protein